MLEYIWDQLVDFLMPVRVELAILFSFLLFVLVLWLWLR